MAKKYPQSKKRVNQLMKSRKIAPSRTNKTILKSIGKSANKRGRATKGQQKIVGQLRHKR